MNLIYERDLRPMKLAILKGTRQDAAVLALASRLGISRQQMRKILITRCDMMTLENLGARLDAADAAARGDKIADQLSLPHLTTATGMLTPETAASFRKKAESGAEPGEIIREIVEVLA